MRINRSGGYISIRDRAAPFWALGLFLLAGGIMAVALPLGLAANAGDLEGWERLASVGVGIGVSAGALWWLWRSPATRVELDITRRDLRLVRWGLSGRQVRRLSFDELERMEVEEGSDSDGDPVWRPAARLRNGELLLLSELWSHHRAGVEEAVAVVAEACRLPAPAGEAGLRRGVRYEVGGRSP
jgi:hypothetical protein